MPSVVRFFSSARALLWYNSTFSLVYYGFLIYPDRVPWRFLGLLELTILIHCTFVPRRRSVVDYMKKILLGLSSSSFFLQLPSLYSYTSFTGSVQANA